MQKRSGDSLGLRPSAESGGHAVIDAGGRSSNVLNIGGRAPGQTASRLFCVGRFKSREPPIERVRPTHPLDLIRKLRIAQFFTSDIECEVEQITITRHLHGRS